MISKPAVLTWQSRSVAGTKENGGDGGVEMIIKEKEEQVSSLLAERQARMGETPPATCIHDVDKNWDILLFNHKYSTLEPFSSSLPPPSCHLQVSQPATPSPPMSLSYPEPSSSLHLQAGHFSSHQEGILSLLHSLSTMTLPNMAGRLKFPFSPAVHSSQAS